MHIKWRDMLTLPSDRNTVLCTCKVQTQHKAEKNGVEGEICVGGKKRKKLNRRWEGDEHFYYFFVCFFFLPEKTGTKMALESMRDMCSNLFLGIRPCGNGSHVLYCVTGAERLTNTVPVRQHSGVLLPHSNEAPTVAPVFWSLCMFPLCLRGFCPADQRYSC